jgi:signal transduction histidine kinase
MSESSLRDRLRRYGLAVLVVAVTVALKILLAGLGDEHPFVLFAGAIAIAAWYGGRGPGVLATLLAAASTLVLFLETPLGVARGPLEPSDATGFAALVAEGLLVALLTAGLRTARRRAEAATAEATVAHREAALALAIRDELLTLWTQKLRGPLADIEAQARAALRDLDRGGDPGAASEKLRALVDDASHVGRVTAGWDAVAEPPGSAR